MFSQFTRYAVMLLGALALAADSDQRSALGRAVSVLVSLGASALPWFVPIALASALIDIVTNHLKEQTAMPGYANRVITLRFEELTQDDEPTIHVVLKNPRLLPPGELAPRKLTLDENGRPIDADEAKRANDEVLAKLIIGWRVFDASDFAVDADGNELPQDALPLPATAELVAKLPTAIYMKITETINESYNPQ